MNSVFPEMSENSVTELRRNNYFRSFEKKPKQTRKNKFLKSPKKTERPPKQKHLTKTLQTYKTDTNIQNIQN